MTSNEEIKQMKNDPFYKGKWDKGKIRYELVPLSAIEALGKVLTFGATRYGDETWRRLPKANDRYYAATLRHLFAYRNGEYLDNDSGFPHLFHALTNIAFLIELKLSEQKDASKQNAQLDLFSQICGQNIPSAPEFDYKERGQDVKLPEFEPLTKMEKRNMNDLKNNEYVICRGYYCGVHAGYIKEREGNHVVLNEARRLWKWKAVKGISLSEVAKYGIDASGSRICTKCGEIWLGDVYEVIPCTDAARKTIEEAADEDVC